MEKLTIKESELRRMVREAVNESFASPTLRQEIMKNGGIKSVTDGFNGTIAGVIDKLTEKDLVNRALNIDDYDEKVAVECKNGKVFTIPLTYDEYERGTAEGEARNNNKGQDAEFGEPSKVYQGAHAGKTIHGEPFKTPTEYGRELGVDFQDAMDALRNDYPWKKDSVARYKSQREKFRLAENDGMENPFYAEEDTWGKTGKTGQVRSYEIGGSYTEQWERDAKKEGMDLEKFVEYWFDEVNDGGMQFSWETLGSGYGYHGDTICTFKNKITNGEVVVKDIFGQLMIDEYCPDNVNESKKSRKKITVSQLKAIVRESLDKILNEGGHLYWHDEEGKAHTNSTETWHGVEGTIFVSHGEWSDPEVLYDDEEINYWDLEDGAWQEYKNDCECDGKEPSEEEYEKLPPSWFQEYLDYTYMPCVFGGGL